MKGEAIAKVGALPKTKRADYAIEIVSTEPIKDGVQVLARAWDKNGRQIGFGRDGTVDIERFIIMNPPILVDDPNGDITKTYVSPDGVTHVRTLREDTKEALLDHVRQDGGKSGVIEVTMGHAARGVASSR
jgi:hypothetical protein